MAFILCVGGEVCLFLCFCIVSSSEHCIFQEFLPFFEHGTLPLFLPALLRTVSVAGIIFLNTANSEVVSSGSGEHLVCVCTENFSSSPESSRATRHRVLQRKSHCYSELKKHTFGFSSHVDYCGVRTRFGFFFSFSNPETPVRSDLD